MKAITQADLDAAPRVGDHYMIGAYAYHLNVIYECHACRDGYICMWKHNERHPKKSTLMLICGIHTDCAKPIGEELWQPSS